MDPERLEWSLQELHVKLAETNGRIDTLENEVANQKDRYKSGVSTTQWIVGMIVLVVSQFIAAWAARPPGPAH